MQKMPLGTLKKNYVQLLCVRAEIFPKTLLFNRMYQKLNRVQFNAKKLMVKSI